MRNDAMNDLQRRMDELDKQQERNFRGLKYSLIVFLVAMALVVISSVGKLLLTLGVLH